MAKIIIMLPKRRMNNSNKKRWKFNKHKKPHYFISELNRVIRTKEDADIYKIIWKDKFKSKYKMRC